MNYRVHTNDSVDGWLLTQESTNIDDFSLQDMLAFLHIEISGCEYVKMGDTMWDIQTN